MIIHLSWLITIYLIAIRLGTVLLFTPIQAIKSLPIRARLFLVFIFALFISLQTEAIHYDPAMSIVISGLCEFANGLILSLSIYAIFSIFQMAGQFIDNQMGLNAATLFNPLEHGHESITARLLSMLAVLIFFTTEGHHRLMEGLVYSFRKIPPGQMILFDGFKPVLQQFSLMFSLSFTIASPVVISLLAIELIGSVLTRSMPQMNVYFLTVPVRILLGIVLLILLLQFFSPLLSNLFNQLFRHWQGIIQ